MRPDKSQKKILFICYPFPPIAGGGVARSLNFVKHFENSQITPSVLTVQLSKEEEAKHKIDPKRLDEISEEVKIFRSKTRFPHKLTNFLESFLSVRLFSYTKFIFFPFLSSHRACWSLFSFFPAAKIIKNENISAIYTTAPPHSVMLLGLLLKLFLKKPWILDFRDPYSDGYQWHWPSKAHWMGARLFEKIAIKNCSQLIVNTPAVKRLYLKRNLKSEDKIEVITNGY